MTIFSTNLFVANALSGWNGFDGMYNMMGGYGVFGWGFMIFFWILVILGIVYLMRLISEKNEPEKNEPVKLEKSAMDILKERYAKGEINKEEFDAKKKDLM